MEAFAPWLERWGLVLEGRPPAADYRTEGEEGGAVAFVRRGREALVLKLLPPDEDETRMAAVLAHWEGRGAVALVEAGEGAVLMERARPGHDLRKVLEAEGDDSATHIACEVMEKLNRTVPYGLGFRTVADWGAGFSRNRAAALSAGMEQRLLDRAEGLFFDLVASQAAPILLHGDLHHYNIVRDEARGWLAIDPKGVLGEPAYEAGALLRNPIGEPRLCADPQVAQRRVSAIAERLGWDAKRITGWGFCQWMLAVLWALEGGGGFASDWMAGPLALERLL